VGGIVASGNDGGGDADKRGFSGLGTILGIAASLIVTVFAALGVSGNLLARMVRDDPVASRNILVLGIVMVVVAAVITAIPRVRNDWVVVPVIGLAVVLSLAAHAAAVSQNKRENPSISLTVSPTPSGGLSLTAKATGSSLKSNDRLLLRVTAITRRLAVTPSSTAATELRTVTDQECKRGELHPYNPRNARLLSWTETGSNVTGEAATEQTMPVPPTAQYVCAWTILSALPTEAREDAPEDLALVDLAGLRAP
jgi:hypothetical protein